MKAEELKGKSLDELTAMLMDLRKEQFGQRFQATTGQLEKTHEIRRIRRDIARVKTFMTLKLREETAAKKPAKKKAA